MGKFPQPEPALTESRASKEGVGPDWSPDTGNPTARTPRPHPGQSLDLGEH